MSYGHFSVDCHEFHHIVSDVAAELVTICGSMRFYDQMLTAAAELSDEGAIVLMPFRVVEPDEQDTAAKAALDQLHRDKISLATSRIVVVSDESGYYGTSTKGEIAFATARGLEVEYRRIGGTD